MALPVDDFSAVAWHSQDAERPEANMKFKKLKPSVPDKKDAEILEANSRCVAVDSPQDFFEKDAETPESKTRRFFDYMKKFKTLKPSKKAMNSQPNVLNEAAMKNLRKYFFEPKHSGKAMKPHPDILKKVAERMEENSHPDILQKGAAGVEARSRCIDDLKKKLEKTKKAMNSHPDILKKADILQKEVENMEARFQYLDFWHEQSEKLKTSKTSLEVPISTEREESDDEIEYSVAPPLKSPRRDLILENINSRHSEDEAERKSYNDDIKEEAKLIVERFDSFSSVFGRNEMWDEARKVFSGLMNAH